MGRPLFLLSIGFLCFGSLLAGKRNAWDQVHLAYTHQDLPLKEMYFLSEEHAIGVGDVRKGKATPLFLFDKHNLIVDTFFAGAETFSLLPQSDSVVFIREEDRTLELLVRKNQMLIQNSLTIPEKVNHLTCKNWKYPLIFDDKVVGQFFHDKKALKMNAYEFKWAVLGEDAEHESEDALFIKETSSRGVKTPVELAYCESDLYVFDPDALTLYRFDAFENLDLMQKVELSQGDWSFFYDHIRKKVVLSEKLNEDSYKLYSLSDEVLVPLEEVQYQPFGVVNGKVHFISRNRSVYTHHLVPLSSESEGPDFHMLDEVQILAH